MKEKISDIILRSEPREAIRIFDELAEDLQKITVKEFVAHYFKMRFKLARSEADD